MAEQPADTERVYVHHAHWEGEPCRRGCHGGKLAPHENPGVIRWETYGLNCSCFKRQSDGTAAHE